jgi:RND family efflux transporter MFP subunit
LRACTLFLCLLAGCSSGGKPDTPKAETDSAQPALLVSPEDVVPVRSSSFAAGPVITGSIQPERRADLRAEVSAVVLAVLKENGDPVRRGELLVRLDDTSIRETLASAEATARAAGQALDQAERQFQRLTTLRASGMVSAPQLEEAEIRRNAAQSETEAARARVAGARQQLQRTEVRAPFDGVVSDRKVSAGDTAQVGKELLDVIDPRSLRFEGHVAADHVGSLRAGQRASFRVLGFDGREFNGRVVRVDPAANATTRQVAVLVAFVDRPDPQVLAGLYAEGRLEMPGTVQRVLPQASIIRDGDKAYAWRITDGRVAKVALTLGARDARTGLFVIEDGLGEGDEVLRHPTASLHDGQAVERVGGNGA